LVAVVLHFLDSLPGLANFEDICMDFDHGEIGHSRDKTFGYRYCVFM
jgi:hypothetical protein